MIVAVVALGMVAAVALPFLFPAAKVKALIEKEAADQLHRQVKLGKISLGLWTGLSVENFELSESPDFSKGTFISSEKIVVRPRLLPLLAKITSAPQGPDVKGTAQLQSVSASFQQAKLTNIVSNIDFTMKDAAGNLTADELKHDYFSGKKLDVKWNLTDAADMAKISGTARMHLGPGEFQNIQKLTSDSKAAKVLFLPLTVLQEFSKATGGAVKIPSLDKVAYKEIDGNYVFKSGVMNITSFNLLGDIGALMKGTVGLSGAQALDLKAQMKLKTGLIGGTLGETFQNKQGQTTLNMIVKGTLDDPKVNIDMKDTGKKILDAVKERLGDRPEEKVKDLLKGLFNR